MAIEMRHRPRRNRKSANLRNLVQENHLRSSDFIYPLFVIAGKNIEDEIHSMPGTFRRSPDLILKHCEDSIRAGIQAIALFPALPDDRKDRMASHSKDISGLYPETIRLVKKTFPELLVFTDVAMDPYSSDGHDGLVNEKGNILNDETLPILADMALIQAQAGADMIAPSDMMDGRIGYIRDHLDENGFQDTGILSYTAKYASAFYGPFRDALDSAPKSGDKKTYQMDPANAREAILELELDTMEGADMVMVKPGLPYLDIIYRLKQNSNIPVAAFNVSGEYAMLKAASINNWIDYKACVLESMISFKRAGADLILSYHALEVATWLTK